MRGMLDGARAWTASVFLAGAAAAGEVDVWTSSNGVPLAREMRSVAFAVC